MDSLKAAGERIYLLMQVSSARTWQVGGFKCVASTPDILFFSPRESIGLEIKDSLFGGKYLSITYSVLGVINTLQLTGVET